MKKLTQDVFDGAPDWVKSAAINKGGQVCWYSIQAKHLEKSILGYHINYWLQKNKAARWATITDGYCDMNWQNSAIDREVA